MNVQSLGTTNKTSISASTTLYLTPFNADTAAPTVEPRMQVKMLSAGTMSLLGCYVSGNDRASSTFRTRINTANGNLAVTINAANTQFEDASNTDVIADDDLVAYQFTAGAGGTTLILETHWVTWAPTTGTVAIIAVDLGGAALSGLNDLYLHPVGIVQFDVQQARFQATIAAAGTVGPGSSCWVQANTRTDTVVFRTAYNTGTIGNIALSYAPAVTDATEDASNTDAVVDGDEVGWVWDQAGGTGTMTARALKMEVTCTNAFPIWTSNTNATTEANGLTYYHALGGRFGAAEVTEADAQQKLNQALTLSDLYGHVSAYSLTAGNLVVTTRKNGTNGNLALTFTATGLQSDVSDTDTVDDDDEWCYSAVTTGSGGTVTLRWLSLLASGAGGEPPPATQNLFYRRRR